MALKIPRERVGFIVTCWTWENSLPNDRVVASQAIPEHRWRNTAGCDNERNVDTLVQSMATEKSTEWRHSGSRRPKKFRKQKSASKMMASVFSEKDGILLVDCLERGATIPLHISLGQSEAINSSAISPGQRLRTRGCQYTAAVGWAALWSAEHLLWPLQTVIWKLKKRLKERKFSTNEDYMPAAASPTCSILSGRLTEAGAA